MSRDILNVDTSFVAALTPESLDLQDLEAVRLILFGSSVIDWTRLDLPDTERVTEFLKLHLIDVDHPEDRERLRFVFNQAINYLEEHHDLRIPLELRDPQDMRDIFLMASRKRGFRRTQALACMILKLMHTINHMDAAELKQRVPLSEAELIDRAEKSIKEFADGMRDEGYPLHAFYGSRKTRTSVITKLLAKRDSIAATIFDKLRFRVVVETPSEIVPVIAHLTRHLFPFNYVIPGASHNTLVNWRKVRGEADHYGRLANQLQRLRMSPVDWLNNANPFSGNSYRVLNFIVDFPVRIDDLMVGLDPELRFMLGSIVYVMVEFQIIDRVTAEANEQGENAHHIYKDRQKKSVEVRLLRGSLAKGG